MLRQVLVQVLGQVARLLPVLIVGLLLAPVPAAAVQVQIDDELARLQAEHTFELTGAELVAGAVGHAEGDDLWHRLRLLLERFDHIILQGPGGSVERVIILGRTSLVTPPSVVLHDTSAASPDADETDDIELETIRSGNQHSVLVHLEGGDGRRVERLLLVDTGADSVVLPASLIAALGIDDDSLGTRDVQTANGIAQARIGTLPAVWLGERRIVGVQAAFLPDDRLGNAGLLGMSVLGRYRLTIDDEHNQLRLTTR
ncbi:MAG: peptidase A2A [Chromatiaceae bacterium]|nr:MAG: peptidase A2A [Chromatiaceae bacterium]